MATRTLGSLGSQLAVLGASLVFPRLISWAEKRSCSIGIASSRRPEPTLMIVVPRGCTRCGVQRQDPAHMRRNSQARVPTSCLWRRHTWTLSGATRSGQARPPTLTPRRDRRTHPPSSSEDVFDRTTTVIQPHWLPRHFRERPDWISGPVSSTANCRPPELLHGP